MPHHCMEMLLPSRLLLRQSCCCPACDAVATAPLLCCHQLLHCNSDTCCLVSLLPSAIGDVAAWCCCYCCRCCHCCHLHPAVSSVATICHRHCRCSGHCPCCCHGHCNAIAVAVAIVVSIAIAIAVAVAVAIAVTVAIAIAIAVAVALPVPSPLVDCWFFPPK